MLTLTNISLSRMGDEIINNVSLHVHPGEVICLYGPSGCGKTTLLHIISKLIDYDSGYIENDFSTLSYLFQDHRLLPWKTLWDNIMLTVNHPNDPAHIEEARYILKKLFLQENDWQKYPKELSGGMRQRAALARALMNKPDLMLLDEPFSALDYELKLGLYEWLSDYTQKGGAIIMVSHDRFEVLKLAHRIYLFQQKPAHCRDVITLDTPFAERDDSFIRHYLQQPYWQAYHD